MDSFTDVGTLPTRGKVLTSLITPPDWQFKGQSQTATAYVAEPDLGDPADSLLSLSRDAKIVTVLRDASWIGGLIKVVTYAACANSLQKVAVLAAPIPGPTLLGW